MQHINNDIQEQRVGFPNAKLLKEKGFKVYGYEFYTPNGKKDPYIAYGIEYMSDCKCKADWNTLVPYPTNEEDVLCSAPTQQIVLDWILENFYLHLIVIPTVTGHYTFKWIDVQLDPENVIERPPYINVDSNDYNTSKETKEGAINHVLTKLI